MEDFSFTLSRYDGLVGSQFLLRRWAILMYVSREFCGLRSYDDGMIVVSELHYKS